MKKRNSHAGLPLPKRRGIEGEIFQINPESFSQIVIEFKKCSTFEEKKDEVYFRRNY
ncbi:MAG: hypothetical protein ACJAT4_000868 [Granulosicoccus sp.]